jgi:hypothetical protein
LLKVRRALTLSPKRTHGVQPSPFTGMQDLGRAFARWEYGPFGDRPNHHGDAYSFI